jgi:hypothetical protein
MACSREHETIAKLGLTVPSVAGRHWTLDTSDREDTFLNAWEFSCTLGRPRVN